MNVRNIIWDFDGTLFDTDRAVVAAFLNVLQSKYGIKESQSRVEMLVKQSTTHCAREMADEYSLEYESVFCAARSTYDEMEINHQGPIEGGRSCCERVIALGGTNVIVTHRDKASCMRFLRYFDFDAYFSQVITLDDGFPFKPSPESFRHVIAANRIDPTSTCGVGDRDIDVGAANSSGISSFYFCRKGTRHEEAYRSISRLAEVEAILE